jgi:uncharacterized protein YlxP (DUF503 family)
MVIGSSVIELDLPGIGSLKEKRSVLKGLIARVHKQFNVSCAEVAVVTTTAAHADQVLQNVVTWIEHNRPDVTVVDHSVEIL